MTSLLNYLSLKNGDFNDSVCQQYYALNNKINNAFILLQHVKNREYFYIVLLSYKVELNKIPKQVFKFNDLIISIDDDKNIEIIKGRYLYNNKYPFYLLKNKKLFKFNINCFVDNCKKNVI